MKRKTEAGKDKYSATWVSHSSMSDFLKCPRLYFLKNVYKNPKTGRKIGLVKPPLALGSAIHSVIEELSQLPVSARMQSPLATRFEKKWARVSGQKGGFESQTQEDTYKTRGEEMIERLQTHPGPLLRKTIKIKSKLPHYWLEKQQNIILCGKIDWLEYLKSDDSVHIIDFKTGTVREREGSLQLPIYYLLVSETQSKKVSKSSYWYLSNSDKPKSIHLPNKKDSYDRILEVATRIRLARKLGHFKCSRGGPSKCVHCAPFEAVVAGQATFVGVGEFNEELYILKSEESSL